MDVKIETEKRLEIAQLISNQLKGIVKGVAIGGSMGFGQNFSVSENSDIDMVIVCNKENLRKLQSTDYFKGNTPENVLNMFEAGIINMFWVTKKINNIEVNCFVYETKGYEKFCIFEESIKAYISTKPADLQTGYGFDGSLLTINRNVKVCGEGYLYERPCFANGKFIGLPPRDDFVRGIHILEQENLFFDKLNDKVWDLTIKKLIEEFGPKVDLTKASILKSEFIYQKKPEKLPKSTIERIKNETEKRLSALNAL